MSTPDAKLAEVFRAMEGQVTDAKDAATVMLEMFQHAFPDDGIGGMAKLVREKMPGLDADLRIFFVREEILAAFHYALVNARAEVRRIYDQYHAGFDAPPADGAVP